MKSDIRIDDLSEEAQRAMVSSVIREEGNPLENIDPLDSTVDVYTALGELSHSTLITEDGLARLLGKNCRETIKRAVGRDELPRPTRLMGKNTWTVGTIIRHIESRLELEAQRFKDWKS